MKLVRGTYTGKCWSHTERESVETMQPQMGVACDQLLGLIIQHKQLICANSKVLNRWPPCSYRNTIMSFGLGIECWSTSNAGFTVTLKSPLTLNASILLKHWHYEYSPTTELYLHSNSHVVLVLAEKTMVGYVPSLTSELVGPCEWSP